MAEKLTTFSTLSHVTRDDVYSKTKNSTINLKEQLTRVISLKINCLWIDVLEILLLFPVQYLYL